jgi:hypothetical protein
VSAIEKIVAFQQTKKILGRNLRAAMDDDPPDDLYDGPLLIDVFRGAVILSGPGSVSLAMTPAAAELSARLLLVAAQKARPPRVGP